MCETFACKFVCLFVHMSECLFVGMYVCIYVCSFVSVYVFYSSRTCLYTYSYNDVMLLDLDDNGIMSMVKDLSKYA